MICKHCGAQLKPGAKFCTKCGEMVEAEPIILTCPDCGHPVSRSQQFCRYCGCELNFSNDVEQEIPEIPGLPVIPQPEDEDASFFESQVKPQIEIPKEDKKQPVVNSRDGINWPGYISLAAAGIGFLSPVRWIVNFAVGFVLNIFPLYYFYPFSRLITFMYGLMHWVCIFLCIAIIAGLVYLISIDNNEDKTSTFIGFIPACCSLISVICTMTFNSGISFFVSIPAILVGLLLANKVFVRREVLRGPFDFNAEINSLKQFVDTKKSQSTAASTGTKKPVKSSVPLVPNERLNQPSYFDGNGKDLFVITIVNMIVVGLTCGLLVPWASVRYSTYECSHTVYNGRRLQFVGSAMDLFIQYLKWIVLTMVTCGIYAPFALVEYTKWISRHTGYEDETPGPNGFEGSDFDGNAFEYFGYTSLGGALTSMSCSIASGWYFNILKYWMLTHTKVCHDRMTYERDTWTNALGVLLINLILIGITCGLYAPWAICRINEYAVARTHIDPNYNYHG